MRARLSLAGLLPLVLGACGCDPCGPADPMSGVNQLPASLEQRVQELRADLEAHGYEVLRGYWTLCGIADCQYAIQTVGNCYGNNPAAPYVLPAVPPWSDEFVDASLKLAFKPLLANTSGTFRLDEREALVILGILPPQGRYFGIQTYVYSREGTINTADEMYARLAFDPKIQSLLFDQTPNPSRIHVFASIGNSNNNVVVQEKSGAAFGQERFFIITPDRVMEREVAGALLRVGVPDPDHIFTEPVSTDLVRVGLKSSDDDFTTVVRYAMPDDSVAGERWREELPLAVLRVRDRNSARATEHYLTPTYDERNANSELGLAGELAELVTAVKEQWQQTGAASAPFVNLFAFVDLVGQHCLGRPMNCLGDGQDTDTYRISRELTIDGGEVIAVVGTLGTATGNATYVSLAVNRWPVLVGVVNVSDQNLAGTAASAFPDMAISTDKFYVHYFARDCTGLSPCQQIPESLVPRGESIKLMQRNYIRPGSKRGANPMQLLSPYSIVLDGTARPSSP